MEAKKFAIAQRVDLDLHVPAREKGGEHEALDLLDLVDEEGVGNVAFKAFRDVLI